MGILDPRLYNKHSRSYEFELEAENARLSEATAQYHKLTEELRGEVARLEGVLENIKAYLLKAGLKEINTGNKIELAIYLSLHEVKQALGEQS